MGLKAGSWQSVPHVVGIDGHDGTGKTTIAKNIALRLGYSYRRPFGADAGPELARAAASGDTDLVLSVGARFLALAIQGATKSAPVILDRSWLTVASLVDDGVFRERWTLWIPTILCWADLPTTLDRLGQRDEPEESTAYHLHYIRRYREIAEQLGCAIVDTSNQGEEVSTEFTARIVLDLLGAPANG
ncbi:hypothetical protein [Paeniglutamicibacter sp.]|uniref:hypothetical protein n=1 Tax=Paeniglutamicibacter sp. TaxID=1934391 RepID=UPI003988EC51